MLKNLDWLSVFLYLALVSIGWICIYATNYNPETANLLDFSQHATKQLFFVGTSLILILLLLSIEPRFYENFSDIFYVVSIILLLGLFAFGKTINGAKAWYGIGSITIQPAEFAKATTALLFAKQLSNIQMDIRNFKDLIRILVIIVVPCGLIILQPVPSPYL